MKKIAIIQLGTLDVQLTIGEILENQTFIVTDKIKEAIKIKDEFENDTTIGLSKFNEIMVTLNHFKMIIESKKVEHIQCFAECNYLKIKNEESFFEQIANKINYRFVILNEKYELEQIYNAVVNSVESAKGVFINIGEYRTYLVQFNRRAIVNFAVLPIGVCNISEIKNYEENNAKSINDIIKEELKVIDWFDVLPEDTPIYSTGVISNNISKLLRRQEKYPFDKDQGYIINRPALNKLYDIVKDVEVDSTKKLKGTTERADIMVNGIAIMNALMNELNIVSLSNSTFSLPEGYLFSMINPNTTSKLISDSLEFSLMAIDGYYKNQDNIEQVSTLAGTLFKQLRVVHGLNKMYFNVLKIAARLFNCGKRVSVSDYEKFGYYTLINSPIYGIGHKEIILAGFVLLYQNGEDNNSLLEWSKYRTILNDDDLIAVKKLSVLLRLAKGFERYNNEKIIDLNVDILGECVILKTIMNQPNSLLEIREAKKAENDFKKVFQRTIQII